MQTGRLDAVAIKDQLGEDIVKVLIANDLTPRLELNSDDTVSGRIIASDGNGGDFVIPVGFKNGDRRGFIESFLKNARFDPKDVAQEMTDRAVDYSLDVGANYYEETLAFATVVRKNLDKAAEQLNALESRKKGVKDIER